MYESLNITAVILCGGQGTRLKDVVADRPKSLAEIDGVPFIYLLLNQIKCAKVHRVLLCTGYLEHMIRYNLGDQYGKLNLEYSNELVPLGTGGALRHALKRIKTELVLVLNGDSYIEQDFMDYLCWHQRVDAKLSIVLKRVTDTERFGSVSVSESGVVTSFTEKIVKGSVAESGYINAGIYIMGRDTISTIPEGQTLSLERELLPSLIGQGVYGYKSQGRFIDIGTPESYRRASAFFSNQLGEFNLVDN